MIIHFCLVWHYLVPTAFNYYSPWIQPVQVTGNPRTLLVTTTTKLYLSFQLPLTLNPACAGDRKSQNPASYHNHKVVLVLRSDFLSSTHETTRTVIGFEFLFRFLESERVLVLWCEAVHNTSTQLFSSYFFNMTKMSSTCFIGTLSSCWWILIVIISLYEMARLC